VAVLFFLLALKIHFYKHEEKTKRKMWNILRFGCLNYPPESAIRRMVDGNLVVTASNKNPAVLWGFLFFISTVQTCLHEYEWKIKRHWLCQWFLFEEEWPSVESATLTFIVRGAISSQKNSTACCF